MENKVEQEEATKFRNQMTLAFDQIFRQVGEKMQELDPSTNYSTKIEAIKIEPPRNPRLGVGATVKDTKELGRLSKLFKKKKSSENELNKVEINENNNEEETKYTKSTSNIKLKEEQIIKDRKKNKNTMTIEELQESYFKTSGKKKKNKKKKKANKDNQNNKIEEI